MFAGTLLGFFGRAGSLVGNMMVTYLIDDHCDTLIIIVAIQLLGKFHFSNKYLQKIHYKNYLTIFFLQWLQY